MVHKVFVNAQVAEKSPAGWKTTPANPHVALEQLLTARHFDGEPPRKKQRRSDDDSKDALERDEPDLVTLLDEILIIQVSLCHMLWLLY